ncbi:MAG: NAD(P)-dependent oxidoreductase [Solitalea-like symbiont of Tyrophagus putrescentiae]
MDKKILIVDDLHPILLDLLKSYFVLDYRPTIGLEEAASIIMDYNGLIIRSKFNVSHEFLEKAQNLEFIARAGAGIDNIDEKAIIKTRVKILNAPEANRDAVAEHALGLLLSLLNNINTSNTQVKDGKWIREGNRGYELNNKTVGIIGYGNTGSSFAKLLRDFNVKILAHDKYKTKFGNGYVNESSLQELLKESDIISLHIPLTEETKYYADNNFFSSLDKPIWFLNTSRGKIVNISALLKAMKAKKILGAALDVLEQEPPRDADWFNDLVNNDKVLLTPHIAGWTYESYKKISIVLANKIKELYGL